MTSTTSTSPATLEWHRGIGGGRYAFVGHDLKVVDLDAMGVLVFTCVARMPVGDGEFFETVAAAIASRVDRNEPRARFIEWAERENAGAR